MDARPGRGDDHLAFVIGTLAGVLSAWRRGGRLDAILPPTLFILSTVPVFFVGLLLIYVFAVKLNWLPLGGNYSLGATPRSRCRSSGT